MYASKVAVNETKVLLLQPLSDNTPLSAATRLYIVYEIERELNKNRGIRS